MITLDEYFKGRDKKYPKEFKEEYYGNAKELLSRVNLFLSSINIVNVKVTSGWRPPSINKRIPRAAKMSLHTVAKAVDIYDPHKALKDLIIENTPLLKVHNLWMEHPAWTKTWVHLDIGTRPERELRIFRP